MESGWSDKVCASHDEPEAKVEEGYRHSPAVDLSVKNKNTIGNVHAEYKTYTAYPLL